MKLTDEVPAPLRSVTRNGTLKAGRAYCQKALEQILRTKEALFREFVVGLEAHRHLLRLALNEAESLAWQTKYPHLVFPDLATEKLQEMRKWNRHQQSVRNFNPMLAA